GARPVRPRVARGRGRGRSARGPRSAPPGVAQRQIGLLIPGLGTTEIFEVICGELAGLARVHDYVLLWGGSARPRQQQDASVEDAEGLCEQFIQAKASGVFFAPFEHLTHKEEVNRRLAERLRQ